MPRERNALRAGLFIITSLVLVIAIIFGIRGWGLVEPTQTRHARFELTDDLSGLGIGDDVRVGGYKVGTVRSIDIVTDEPEAEPYLRVTFTMPRDLVVRETATVQVQDTLTGLSWLNFDRLGTGEPLAPEVPLPGRSSPMRELMVGLGTVVPDLQELVQQVRTETVPAVNRAVEQAQATVQSFDRTANEATQLVQDVRGRVEPTLQSYQALADRGTETLTEVRDLVSESRSDVRETAANLNAATETMRDNLPELLDQIETALVNLNDALEGINGAMDDVTATAANTREITDAARTVIVRNRGRLEGIVAAVRTTSENLRGASAEIRRAPWRLFYRPRPSEMINITLFESTRQFAEGAGELHDAARALRDALDDPAIDEAELQRLLEHVHNTFHNFHEVEQQLWAEVRQ